MQISPLKKKINILNSSSIKNLTVYFAFLCAYKINKTLTKV